MREKIASSKTARFAFHMLWYLLSKTAPSMVKRWLFWELKEGAFDTPPSIDSVLTTHVFGKTFKTPIGIFLPFKGAEYPTDALIESGFGFGEFGPYTLNAQKTPQKIKFLAHKNGVALQGDGYPNPGLPPMAPFFFKRRRFQVLTGVNLISSPGTEPEALHVTGTLSAREELEAMVQKIAPYCEYIVINAAHPSSEFYEIVGNHDIMFSLIKSLKETATFMAPFAPPKILLEIPFDLTPAQMLSVGEIVRESALDGVIIAGPHVMSHAENPFNNASLPVVFYGAGTQSKITTQIRDMYRMTQGNKTIIAAGGVMNATDAFEQLAAGASLIRTDTALFFNGPGWLNKLYIDLADLIKKNGFSSVKEVIGSAADESE